MKKKQKLFERYTQKELDANKTFADNHLLCTLKTIISLTFYNSYSDK